MLKFQRLLQIIAGEVKAMPTVEGWLAKLARGS
jgi:hypothetical protein